MRAKAQHLLDIDGDSVHHAHNAAKSFTAAFEYYLEGLFNTLHSDFFWSEDLRALLEKICLILNIKYTVPERFTALRFLSAHKLAVDTIRLLDSYTVFYYAFLEKSENQKYKSLLSNILKRHEVLDASKQELDRIHVKLKKKVMTKDGKDRKQRILNKLFDNRERTRIQLSMYMSVLDILKEYAVLFQTKEPMIHVLHDEQVRLLKEFLAYFVKPQCIPKKPAEMKQLQLKDDILLNKSDMFTGSVARKLIMKKGLKDPVVSETLEALRTAYVNCGNTLIKKMPVDNKLLECLSSLDPEAKGHSLSLRLLKRLPQFLRTVIKEDEEDEYEKEVHRFHSSVLEQNAIKRIDHWWASQTTAYPKLSKVALAALTCFHGPLVEGAFNIMGDIMDVKSASLGIESLRSIQIVKSSLMAKKTTATEFFRRKDRLYTPVRPGLLEKMVSAGRMRNEDLSRKRTEKQRKKNELSIKKRTVLTKRAAHDLASDHVKRARIDHMQDTKQKKC